GVTLLPGMAVEAGIASNTTLAVKSFDQVSITRQIGLMWRKKTPRRVEFRQLGELIAALVEA
ncbi:MAG: hydrogen peroxide-inducible genes activator, partial [Luminiphilus sp.]